MNWFDTQHKRILLYCLLIGICCVLFLWPLWRPGFIVTDDGDWMIIRLSAFYQSLREGQFPVRLLGRLNYSYGYPVSNFLYPGFLYIGSFIHALGIPFVETIKIIIGGSVIVTSLSLFLWCLRFASPLASFVGVLSFLLSPYLAFDIYRRGSVGEILAIAAIALCLYALESSKKHLFTIALSLLVISHNSVAFISLPVLLFYSLIRGKRHVFISIALALGITTFFWFPALYEKKFVRFDSIIISDPKKYFSVNAEWFLLSVSQIIAFFLILFKRKKETSSTIFLLVSFACLTILTLPLSSPLWEIHSFAKLFQFPYRFLSVLLLFGSLLVSLSLDRFKREVKIALSVLLIAILVPSTISSYQRIERTLKPEVFYTTNEATTTVANEYLPHWVTEPPTERSPHEVEFFKGRGTIIEESITTQKVVAQVIAVEESILQINSIYYPGWGAFINGVPAEISYDNPRGVIRFPIKEGTNHVIAEFRETVPRFVATAISGISVVIFIIAVLVPDRIKQKVYTFITMLSEPIPQIRRKKR